MVVTISKDPLDIPITPSLYSQCVPGEAKVIEVMQMIDNGDADDKIIAVAAHDPSAKITITLKNCHVISSMSCVTL